MSYAASRKQFPQAAAWPRQRVHDFDVVIAGAGTAGCFLAGSLPRDLRVLLLDEKRFPRSKACGGLLVEESQAELAGLGMPRQVFSSPSSTNLCFVDVDNGLSFRQERRLVNVDRFEFDSWLHGLARENVFFASGTKVESVENNGRASVTVSHAGRRQTISASCVIGADGANSLVRKCATDVKVNRLLAFQEVGVPARPLGDTLFIFNNRINDYYSWVIPKNGSVVIGSAFESARHSRFYLLKYLLHQHGLAWKTIRHEGALLSRPLSRQELCLGRHKVLLVGEAAGLVSPTFGEGISYALRSARAAARAVSERLPEGGEAVLREYERLAAPVVKDVAGRIERAKALSSPAKRKQCLASLVKGGK